jgi:Fanconi anemia group M protein
MFKSGGRPPKSLYQAAIAQAAAMKINHAIELAETQGTATLQNYLMRLEAEAGSHGSSKAAISISKDPKFKKVLAMSQKLNFEHPKLAKSVDVVKKQFAEKSDSRIIVFTHYRETSDLVMEALNRHKNINAVRFIGQASKNGDKGLRQKEQVKLIQKFKEGVYNVLVATSVAEEGLDIPSTDLVVFYEPIPSEIRTIQRRGRTGRRRAGKVVILIAKNTRDEAYYWTARSKEKQMRRELQILRDELRKKLKIVGEPKGADKSIDDFSSADKNADAFEFNEIVTTPEEEPDEYDSKLIRTTVEAEQSTAENIRGSPVETEPGEAGYELEIIEGEKPAHPGSTGNSKHEPGTTEEPKPDEPTPLEVPRITTDEELLRELGQSSLADFSLENNEIVRIITDTREFNSNVAKQLSLNNVQVESLQLGAGDYILSESVAVERKKTNDLMKSLMDGRLFTQLKKLKALYLNPILIIEGPNPFTSGNIAPNAISGVLASIITDYRIPIITTRDELETVKILITIAKREQLDNNRTRTSLRSDKGIMTVREQQQFIVEGLPNVSSIIAQRLLTKFGTVGKIFQASVEELCEVKGIGKKTAEEIRSVIEDSYQ